jgi:S1-C subfamily serine protease
LSLRRLVFFFCFSLLSAQEENIFKGGDAEVDRITSAIVSLYVKFSGKTLDQGKWVERGAGRGTGFLISPDGLLITAAHVVGNNKSVKAKLSDQRELGAEIVGLDPIMDIALLKLVGAEGNFSNYLEFVESGEIKTGNRIIAVGDSLGTERSTFTTGIVSATHRWITLSPLTDYIQFDAAIYGGNSGGPLLNPYGKVVGVNLAGRTDAKSINYALPAFYVLKALEQLKKGAAPEHPFLGIAYAVGNPFSKDIGLSSEPGLFVMGVVKDSPAAKSGLLYGDQWVSLEYLPIKSPDDVEKILNTKEIGSVISLGFKRDQKMITVELTITNRPKIPAFSFPDFSRAYVGFDVAPDVATENFKIVKIFAMEENKKYINIKEGDFCATLAPASVGGIPEKLTSSEAFVDLIRHYCSYDEDSKLAFVLEVLSAEKNKSPHRYWFSFPSSPLCF